MKIKTPTYMKHLSILLFLIFSFSHFFISSALAQAIKTTLVSGTGPNNDEGPKMVCDGNYDTKWCIDSPRMLPYSIVLDAGEETNIAEYGFVTGDDTSSYPDRNPVTWRIMCSNDKQNWVLFDEHKNDRSIGDENEQEYRFKPTGPKLDGKYRYFSFEFIEMAGGTRIQLSEINLYKTAKTAIKTTFVSGSGRDTKEGAAMVSDDLLYTKWCLDEPRQMPYSVVLDAGEQTAVSEYVFVTGDDTHTYPDRNPVTWSVSGSNDKQNWTPLDEQKFNRRLRDENEQEYRFKVPSPASFRYYRFQFIRMAAGTRLQLSEIKLYK